MYLKDSLATAVDIDHDTRHGLFGHLTRLQFRFAGFHIHCLERLRTHPSETEQSFVTAMVAFIRAREPNATKEAIIDHTEKLHVFYQQARAVGYN
jgi:hypothetical protein